MSNQAQELTVGDVLFQKVYAPAFLLKCAEFGIVPQSEEELSGLLEIAAGIRIKEAELAQQSQANTGTVIKSAAAGMRNILGVEQESAPAVNVDLVKAASSDPDVQAALAALQQK